MLSKRHPTPMKRGGSVELLGNRSTRKSYTVVGNKIRTLMVNRVGIYLDMASSEKKLERFTP